MILKQLDPSSSRATGRIVLGGYGSNCCKRSKTMSNCSKSISNTLVICLGTEQPHVVITRSLRYRNQNQQRFILMTHWMGIDHFSFDELQQSCLCFVLFAALCSWFKILIQLWCIQIEKLFSPRLQSLV